MNVGSPGDDYYLGSRVNDDNDNFMDFVLEGKTDGWVAVGFSTSKTMVYTSLQVLYSAKTIGYFG